MTNSYARACTEVLELLRYYFSKEDYNKIPKDVINFYEKNKDVNYQYKVNSSLPLEKQEISETANAIIVTIFRDYFATESQKVKLDNILINNDITIEQQKREKYNPDNLFKNNTLQEEEIEKSTNENNQIPEYTEENIFQKLLNKIKDFLYRNRK